MKCFEILQTFFFNHDLALQQISSHLVRQKLRMKKLIQRIIPIFVTLDFHVVIILPT